MKTIENRTCKIFLGIRRIYVDGTYIGWYWAARPWRLHNTYRGEKK